MAGDVPQYVSWIHDADFVRAIDLLIARVVPLIIAEGSGKPSVPDCARA